MYKPIIFIHYGHADYLVRVFAFAKKFNFKSKLILLGDETNRNLVGGCCHYIPFESLAGSAKEQEFQKVFQPIQGERHRFNKANGVEFWLKFVFRRWFLIEAFLQKEGLDSFWTFDSDTLILADLSHYIDRFNAVEAMTQCKGQCLNGWVGSRSLVSEFTQSILEQFRDDNFIEAQRERLKQHNGLAFNEMDAFAEFRRRNGIKTLHGQIPVNGEIFDDALAFASGFEVNPRKVLEKTAIKRLWTDGGNIYARHLESNSFVRLLTCNMSWMPTYMWRRIIFASRSAAGKSDRTNGKGFVDETKLREISTLEPVGDKILRKANLFLSKARQLSKS